MCQDTVPLKSRRLVTHSFFYPTAILGTPAFIWRSELPNRVYEGDVQTRALCNLCRHSHLRNIDRRTSSIIPFVILFVPESSAARRPPYMEAGPQCPKRITCYSFRKPGTFCQRIRISRRYRTTSFVGGGVASGAVIATIRHGRRIDRWIVRCVQCNIALYTYPTIETLLSAGGKHGTKTDIGVKGQGGRKKW